MGDGILRNCFGFETTATAAASAWLFRRDRCKSARANGGAGSCLGIRSKSVLPGEGRGLLPVARPFERAVPSRAVTRLAYGRAWAANTFYHQAPTPACWFAYY